MVARRWGWNRVSPSWEPGQHDEGDASVPKNLPV